MSIKEVMICDVCNESMMRDDNKIKIGNHRYTISIEVPEHETQKHICKSCLREQLIKDQHVHPQEDE
jgi:hypothetical protein